MSQKQTISFALLVSLMLALAGCRQTRTAAVGGSKKSGMDSIAVSPVAPGAQPVLIANDFAFTEGPTANAAGAVFFTDQPNNRIWKWSAGSGPTIFLEPAGRANGMWFNRSGDLLVCADEKNEIWSIGPDKKVQVLLGQVAGKKLNGPNDLWSDRQGGIYFTDPYYQRPYWERKAPEMPGQYVYYLPAGAAQPVVVDSTLRQPNGIVGSPDGRFLYVADIGGGKTYRYTISGAGKLTGKTLFFGLGSDGMTLDEKGNLYLTGKGVTIVSAAGTQIGHIPIPEPWTANLCFGGPDRSLLFITASKAVYTVNMRVRGAW